MVFGFAKKTDQPSTPPPLPPKSSSDATPLILAIQKGDWDNVRTLLTKAQFSNPEQKSMELQIRTCLDNGDLRSLPIHVAISNYAPFSIVETLVKLYPGGCEIPDHNGNLPLHLAFMVDTPDIAAMLMRSYHDGVLTANSQGHYPMEFASVSKESDEDSLQSCLETMEAYAKRDKALLHVQIAAERSKNAIAQRQLRSLQQKLSLEKKSLEKSQNQTASA